MNNKLVMMITEHNHAFESCVELERQNSVAIIDLAIMTTLCGKIVALSRGYIHKLCGDDIEETKTNLDMFETCLAELRRETRKEFRPEY